MKLFKNYLFFLNAYAHVKALCGPFIKKTFFACVCVALFAKLAMVFQPIFLGKIIDILADKSNDGAELSVWLLIFCFIGFVSSLAEYSKNALLMLIRSGLERDLSVRFYERLQTFSHEFYHHRNVSKISEIKNSGLEAVQEFVAGFLFEVLPFLFGLLLILFVIITKANLSISIPLLLTFMLYGWVSIMPLKKEKKSIIDIRETRTLLASQFYENIINFDSIKLTISEKSRLRGFSRLFDTLYGFSSLYAKLFFTKSFFQSFVLYFGLFFVLTVTIQNLIHGKISSGDFIMINSYFFQINLPLVTILRMFDTFRKTMINIKPFIDLLTMKPELTILEPRIEKIVNPIDVRFDKVSFSRESKKVVSEISFQLSDSKKISLVGHSGGGKSTIAKLLVRFFDPHSGFITINGVDIRQIPFQTLRTLIGCVPQDIVLLQDTILNNIVMDDDTLSISDVFAMTADNHILDFVRQLKEGLYTIVGDRGLKLSGGQKQRIGIARALIRKPKILILDESSSSLDIKTENMIQKHLQHIQCSMLVIAHRLSLVADSDEILVIQDGTITQRGKHLFLLNQPGWYKDSWEEFLKREASFELA